ncbi:hypothetical protein GGI18_005100, partial [Coemansia linderi]
RSGQYSSRCASGHHGPVLLQLGQCADRRYQRPSGVPLQWTCGLAYCSDRIHSWSRTSNTDQLQPSRL